MPRLIWLADEIRKAGLRVIEVDGWKTRGSEDFNPEGITWHATAGSRRSTAMAEVGVLLHGSTTAPPPIAQLMLYRDGTFYVCAAGRCNHNKVGWDGPNKGLGNTRLLGIEMANDNKGEPWPAVQLDAARRGTAAILKRLGVDPMRRLAAHYEHQPYATRPPGEGSTKSDPHGVRMSDERPRVAALMQEDDVSAQDVIKALQSEDGKTALTAWANSPGGQKAIGVAVGNSDVVPRLLPDGTWAPPTDAAPRSALGKVISYLHKDLWLVKKDLGGIKGGVTQTNQNLLAVADRVGAAAAELTAFNLREAAEVPPTATANAAAVIARLAETSIDELEDVLRRGMDPVALRALGGRLLTGPAS
jgi:hypothetical protein